ncbi:MAG: ATP-binding protein, partial [Pleurocapsa sp. MO_226.B13]|nr:ATP-binding protein [Pleurocapsa sp. MO_226.B13]
LSAKTRDLATSTSDNRDRQLILANYQLQTANRDLLNLNRDLEHFASLVSHDLQAPLRSLTMFSELLIDEYRHELDPQAQKYLERISNSSSKMQALIEDLLAYSRAGKSEQTWIVVDLNQTLQQVQENLHDCIASEQAQINVSNLPKILINPTEILQLLQNLLENAIKFSDCQSPQIEVTAVQREREWLISITDNGIGIAAEFHSEIFQVFKRLNSAETYPGTGMGLAICQKIVERYGGKIWVESSLGEGSTFYFTLPLDICPQTLAPQP